MASIIGLVSNMLDSLLWLSHWNVTDTRRFTLITEKMIYLFVQNSNMTGAGRDKSTSSFIRRKSYTAHQFNVIILLLLHLYKFFIKMVCNLFPNILFFRQSCRMYFDDWGSEELLHDIYWMWEIKSKQVPILYWFGRKMYQKIISGLTLVVK